MSSLEIGDIVLTLSVLLAAVHVLGYLAEQLRQPRLVGELLAGAMLGPFVLGQAFPDVFSKLFGASAPGAPGQTEVVLNFLNWIGLFLLMFLSGSETRRLMAKENRRQTAWLLGVGTTLPFLVVLVLGSTSLLSLTSMIGPARNELSALLVLSIAVAVTSIPVISRIFMDLGIIRTRFASLVLGFAVLEDILLWGVLAIATGIGKDVSASILAAFAYMGFGLAPAPKILTRLHDARSNLLIRASPVGYLFFILFIYLSAAAAMHVNLVFGAFLAGFGIAGGMEGTGRARFSEQLESISKVGRGVFIPIYFALTGFKLVLGRDFSPTQFVLFLVLSSLISMGSFWVASRLAGFRGRDVVNLVITKNARGGPGIVLASVAFEAGIINAAFYTTLVLTAVVTSQAAGMWLRYVLSRGWPLLARDVVK